jgi:nucleotide-binding universal stress UspA family protein
MSFDRYVVGVDGTEYGLEALRQALTLAGEDATIDAVIALYLGVAAQAGIAAPHAAAELEREAEQIRSAAADLLAGRPRSEARIVSGEPVPALLAAAARPSTLLVLGAKRRSRLLGLMLGTTATTLLREAPGSVFLARLRWGETWSPRRIVVGIDGSEQSLRALEVADGLAERHGAVVTVVSATGGKPVVPDGPWASRVSQWSPDHPVAALIDPTLEADLLVLGSRGLHSVHALGSVSERVAHRALSSVLVVRG